MRLSPRPADLYGNPGPAAEVSLRQALGMLDSTRGFWPLDYALPYRLVSGEEIYFNTGTINAHLIIYRLKMHVFACDNYIAYCHTGLFLWKICDTGMHAFPITLYTF